MTKTVWPILICLSVLCSCASQSESSPASSGTSAAEAPALHAIQDRELRVLMDRMNSLMMERFMTEHEMDIERRRSADQIIAAAKNLAVTAKILIQKLPGLDLKTAEQKAFHDLAGKLEQDAHRLQIQAENQSFAAISGTLTEMKSTCLACHTLFRKL